MIVDSLIFIFGNLKNLSTLLRPWIKKIQINMKKMNMKIMNMNIKKIMMMIIKKTTMISAIFMMINFNSLNIILPGLSKMLTVYAFNLILLIPTLLLFICTKIFIYFFVPLIPLVLLCILIFIFSYGFDRISIIVEMFFFFKFELIYWCLLVITVCPALLYPFIPIILLVLLCFLNSIFSYICGLINWLIGRFFRDSTKYKPGFYKLNHSLIYFLVFCIIIICLPVYQWVWGSVVRVLDSENIFILFFIINLIYPIIYNIIYIIEKSKSSYKNNPSFFISERISKILHLKCINIIASLFVLWLGSDYETYFLLFESIGLITVIYCTDSEDVLARDLPWGAREYDYDVLNNKLIDIIKNPMESIDQTRERYFKTVQDYERRVIYNLLGLQPVPSSDVTLVKRGHGYYRFLGIVPEHRIIGCIPTGAFNYVKYKVMYVPKTLTNEDVVPLMNALPNPPDNALLVHSDLRYRWNYLLMSPKSESFGLTQNTRLYVNLSDTGVINMVLYDPLNPSHVNRQFFFADLDQQRYYKLPGYISASQALNPTPEGLNVVDITENPMFSYQKEGRKFWNLNGKFVPVDYAFQDSRDPRSVGFREYRKFKLIRFRDANGFTVLR